MFSSFADFFNMIRPLFDCFSDILSFPLFGVAIWRYIFSLFLFAFVCGFISVGHVSLSGITNSSVAVGRSLAFQPRRQAGFMADWSKYDDK